MTKCKRLSDSLIADAVMLILIVANITLRWTAGQPEEASFWMQSPLGKDAGPSLAGTYFLFFCMPVMQFILLRWIWRWTIWFIFFRGISKMPLKLRPAHADEAGGIGFLGTPPGPFLMVTLAMAILFSSSIFEKIVFLNYKLPEYYISMGAFVIILIIINILPLFVFIKPLVKCRRQAIMEYGAIVSIHHSQFDEKWINSQEPESLLGNPDASSAADINSVFLAIKSMKTLPFNIKIMASTIVISAIPMLPLFALQYSVAQIIKGVLKLLV